MSYLHSILPLPCKSNRPMAPTRTFPPIRACGGHWGSILTYASVTSTIDTNNTITQTDFMADIVLTGNLPCSWEDFLVSHCWNNALKFSSVVHNLVWMPSEWRHWRDSGCYTAQQGFQKNQSFVSCIPFFTFVAVKLSMIGVGKRFSWRGRDDIGDIYRKSFILCSM